MWIRKDIFGYCGLSFLESPELPMVPAAAQTETKCAFEPNIEGSTSFCVSAAVSKEFPKPDVVNSSLAASAPEDEAGQPNKSMDNPTNGSMNGGSTSFSISKTVPMEFPKPDIVNPSSAASTPEVSEECSGQLNSNSMDDPDVSSMKGTFSTT